MNPQYRAYPPQLADDVEIIEQTDGVRLTFVVGSTSSGRFILTGETESRVLRLLTGTLTAVEICQEYHRLYGAKPGLPTLKKFLARLDQIGLLAGQRDTTEASSSLTAGSQFYVRFKLFNPDRLFERVIPFLGWIWTRGFVISTLILMCFALILSVTHPSELASYGIYTLREHYLAVFIAGLVVGFSHEFAHGLTCKAFGGRVTEVGVLMIYYLLPALYCNVSGAYLIPQRSRRLWVIFAGIYWQLLIGALALLIWFAVERHTLISDTAFILFLGSVVDVIFNANPLIKLDGYYFLSQLLRMPNLMDRSRSYWRGLFKRTLFGERDDAARRPSRRERAIYAAFGLASFTYTVGLRTAIVFYVGSYLTDHFNMAGLAFASGLSAFYLRQPLRQITSAVGNKSGRLLRVMREKIMKRDGQVSTVSSDRVSSWRRRAVWLTLALIAAIALCLPWTASVGSYGTLLAMEQSEAVIRAPEAGTLIELRARPGERVSSGALIARMGNLELEEQIVEAKSELARANADYERLLGEIRVREEATAQTRLELERRRHDFEEINTEREQINRRRAAAEFRTVKASNASNHSHTVSPYPAALAALQADIDLLQVQLQEATAQADRSRSLFNKGVVSRSEIESAETRAETLALELVRARERMEAALIEHRRKHTGSSIEMKQANSEVRVEHLQTELLGSQLSAARELRGVIESRLSLLERKQGQYKLMTPQEGTIYGEELPRMKGRYLEKGEEICRVADTERLIVRIQLPEREMGEVRVGQGVRLKVRAETDRIFHGVVSKIGGEGELDENNQTSYRVEVEIENREGLLRPGMTAFARIDYGRRMIGWILMHKFKQLLRPELWML